MHSIYSLSSKSYLPTVTSKRALLAVSLTASSAPGTCAESEDPALT